MRKNKIFKIIVFSLLITSIGSFSVIASSNSYIKNKVNALTAEFNSKKDKLEKKGNYRIDSKEAKEVKKLGIEADKLNKSVQTEEEYKVQLEGLIEGCKLGLEDTKREQKTDYSEKTQEFIDKMEKKIDTIESQMKQNDKVNKQLKIDSLSDNESISKKSSSKELIEKLLDHSDVE